MSTKISPEEAMARTVKLKDYIAEHGLVKVAFAAKLGTEGLSKCAQLNGKRLIADTALELIHYRLADKAVWESKEWDEAQADAIEQRKVKAKIQKDRRDKIRIEKDTTEKPALLAEEG